MDISGGHETPGATQGSAAAPADVAMSSPSEATSGLPGTERVGGSDAPADAAGSGAGVLGEGAVGGSDAPADVPLPADPITVQEAEDAAAGSILGRYQFVPDTRKQREADSSQKRIGSPTWKSNATR